MQRVFTIRGTVLLLQFLSGDCFKRQIAAYGVYEVQGAKFCESKLYPATSVRNFILDEVMGRKGSGICDSKDGGNWQNQPRVEEIQAAQASGLLFSANENGLKLW
jgi:hypothetical protein